MSALSIQVPFPVFQDRDGQPLDNGYVWLGTSSLNPQTNPVVAYYDSALTIVATQPLRTLNGFISRAGSPAQVYVDAVNFSILVQDSKGTTVFSVPEGTGISPNASGVVYDPAGTGAVASTVQAKLRESVSVKDFGAVGDGVHDDTTCIQAALNHCVLTGKSLYLPSGIYETGPLVITFPGANLSFPQHTAFEIYGDGGYYQRGYGVYAPGNSVLRYSGSSGIAMTTAGGSSAQLRLNDFLIYGTAGTYNSGVGSLTGTTAKGLRLVGAIDHEIGNVCITGFDIGCSLYFSFVGNHLGCQFTQNNVNVHYDSATNAITSTGCNYHEAFKTSILIRPETSTETVRNLVFINPLCEGSKIGICIDPQSQIVRDITFINPYFEENDELFRIGYDLTGTESLLLTEQIVIDQVGYSGNSPTTAFRCSKLNGLYIGRSDIQTGPAFMIASSSVVNVEVKSHKYYGGAFTLPLSPLAFGKSIQRKAPYNLIQGGNYLVSGGGFIKSTYLMTESYGFVGADPVLTLTIPTGGPYNVEWKLNNLTSFVDVPLQLNAAIQLAAGVTGNVGLYDNAGSTIGGVISAFSTTEITTLGVTPTPLTGVTYGTVRAIFNNSSGSSATIKIRGVGLFTRDAGPIVTDAMDALVSLSGTVLCSPTATVAVPFISSLDYRVIVTPLASATAYVTKSNTSFVITCTANVSVDYVVMPIGRILA